MAAARTTSLPSALATQTSGAAMFAPSRSSVLCGRLCRRATQTARSPAHQVHCSVSRVRGWPDQLDRLNLLGLRALGAAASGELDPLVLLEAAVALCLDGGVVHEDVGGAVVRLDKTEALVGVEPLHGALSHLFSPADDLRETRVCIPGRCDRPSRKIWPEPVPGRRCQNSQALCHVHELRLQPIPLNTADRADGPLG